MTQHDRYSLEDLERHSGVSARQVRELIRIGILPAASSGGRGAHYGAAHLERLRAWRRLKSEAPAGTTNEQIRVLLDRLNDTGLLRGIGEGTIPFSLVDDQREDVTVRAREPKPAPNSSHGAAGASTRGVAAGRNEDALAYLERIRAGANPPVRVAAQKSTLLPTLEVDLRAGQHSAAGIALARLRAALEDHVARHAPSVRVAPVESESLHRVVVGRDLEIVARGPLDSDEIQLLETIGQLLQQALYRRTE